MVISQRNFSASSAILASKLTREAAGRVPLGRRKRLARGKGSALRARAAAMPKCRAAGHTPGLHPSSASRSPWPWPWPWPGASRLTSELRFAPGGHEDHVASREAVSITGLDARIAPKANPGRVLSVNTRPYFTHFISCLQHTERNHHLDVYAGTTFRRTWSEPKAMQVYWPPWAEYKCENNFSLILDLRERGKRILIIVSLHKELKKMFLSKAYFFEKT